jgi:DNA-binding NarL/FixJ family response regulator
MHIRDARRARGNSEPHVDPQEQRRVLLADDEELFCRAAAELIRQAGYLCDWVHDAAEAVRAVERGRYDVVVADINMDGNHELELVREIRERFADLPVIIVTAHPSVPTAIQALRLSAVDYIQKPVNFDELIERMDEAIEARQQRRSAAQHLQGIGPVVRKLQSIHQGLAQVVGEHGAATPLADELDASGPLSGSRDPRSATTRAGEEADVNSSELVDLLSPREREILEAVASGQRVRTIARVFTISPFTVRNHLKAIFRKLGVHSQVELLAQLHGRSRPNHRGQGSA